MFHSHNTQDDTSCADGSENFTKYSIGFDVTVFCLLATTQHKQNV